MVCKQDWVSAGRVAEVTGYSPRWIQALCKDGALRARRAGERGNWRVHIEAACSYFKVSRHELIEGPEG